jgi:hypothetical protein
MWVFSNSKEFSTDMIKKTIAAVCTLLMTAVLLAPFSTYAQDGDVSLQGVDDSALTGINFQHTGSNTTGATVEVQLLPQDGGSPVNLSNLSLSENGVENIYLPDVEGLSSGNYSLVATSDDPVGAIVRTDFSNTGAAGIYSSVAPGETVIVPLVTRNYASQTSIITVQSAGSSGSTFDVDFVALGDSLSSPTFSNNGQSLGAGRSVTYDLRDGAFSSLNGGAAGTPGVDPNNSFLGFVQVEVTSGDPVVVQSLIDILGVGAAGSFNGVAADSAATTLYAPLLRANFFGDTGIQLVNPNADTANVTITFLTDPISESAGYASQYTQQLTIAGNSGINAFQGPTGNSRGGTGIPTTAGGPSPDSTSGWLGAGKIESDQPLLAVVNDTAFTTNFQPSKQTSYNAATASDGGSRFALPLVRSRHVNSLEVTSGIQVLNIDPSNPAEVTITVINSDDSSQTLPSRTVPAEKGSNFYFGTPIEGVNTTTLFPGISGVGGWFGSAIVEATGGDIVIVVDDANFPAAPTQLDSANYNGISLQ